MPFKKKMSEEDREAFDAMIERARQEAREEERDGQRFRVLRLPDQYGPTGPAGGLALREDQVDTLERAE